MAFHLLLGHHGLRRTRLPVEMELAHRILTLPRKKRLILGLRDDKIEIAIWRNHKDNREFGGNRRREMQKPVRYLETDSTDAYYNLAFEEFVLKNRREGDYLLLWQNDNTIVVGQNQNTEAEINRAFVDSEGITVARRTTGGGAVYHDLGNLNYSFITDVEDAERMVMTRFTQPVVEALKALGVAAEASGRNDILAEGRKVSGTAQRLVGRRILHHGTLLFDSDMEKIAGALQADPAKFHSKSAKSVRSRVGNIRACLREDMDMERFWAYLKTALSGGAGIVPDSLSAEELAQVGQLREEKYATWAWNFGVSPKFDFSAKRKWPGGILEISVAVERGGNLSAVAFYGDFMARQAMDEVTAALMGQPFRREDVARALDAFVLTEYFGGITKEEILETIFGSPAPPAARKRRSIASN